jgi:hypothetical protein
MTWKGFKTNFRLHEPMAFQFSERGISCIGESFSSTYSWDKIRKVRLFQGWLLIYHSSMTFSLARLQSKDELYMPILKDFLQSQNNKIKISM